MKGGVRGIKFCSRLMLVVMEPERCPIGWCFNDREHFAVSRNGGKGKQSRLTNKENRIGVVGGRRRARGAHWHGRDGTGQGDRRWAGPGR